MPLEHHTPGFNSVPEYQVSGVPYVTSSASIGTSAQGIDFPYVTRNVVVRVSGSIDLRVGFTLNGVNNANYFLVPSGAPVTLEIRTKRLFVRADQGTTGYSLCAGMTTIPERNMQHYTGSTGLAGVG